MKANRKIAIIINITKEQAVKCAESILRLFKEGNEPVEVLMLQEMSGRFNGFKIHFYENIKILFEQCDAAVTVGGDGTIIHAAKFAAMSNKPLVGVNVGRVGFAAELEPDEIFELKRIITMDYNIENRMLLEVTVNKSNINETFTAVNDAVISRGSLSRMIDLSVYFNNENMVNYRADGLIISTPTGSTAYSLSAGGPVIDPRMQCILLAPICPHSLYSRPIVFGETSVISVLSSGSGKFESYKKSNEACTEMPAFHVLPVRGLEGESFAPDYLTIDGQEMIPLSVFDKVEIKKSKLLLKLISLKDKNFYRRVSEKLKGREG